MQRSVDRFRLARHLLNSSSHLYKCQLVDVRRPIWDAWCFHYVVAAEACLDDQVTLKVAEAVVEPVTSDAVAANE